MKKNCIIKIKEEIALRNDCEIDAIECKNCRYWGYNNGKEMNSTGDSRCSIRREKTFALQFCKKFKKKEE